VHPENWSTQSANFAVAVGFPARNATAAVLLTWTWISVTVKKIAIKML